MKDILSAVKQYGISSHDLLRRGTIMQEHIIGAIEKHVLVGVYSFFMVQLLITMSIRASGYRTFPMQMQPITLTQTVTKHVPVALQVLVKRCYVR